MLKKKGSHSFQDRKKKEKVLLRRGGSPKFEGPIIGIRSENVSVGMMSETKYFFVMQFDSKFQQ